MKMVQYSRMICDQMSDQQLDEDVEKEAGEGRSIAATLPRNYENDANWFAIAQWMMDQYERLEVIVKSSDSSLEAAARQGSLGSVR